MKISAGTAITTTHAPSRNFVPNSTTTVIAVITAPAPFTLARSCQRRGLALRQWRTSPIWLSVKPMNTPIAYSGISFSVWAPTAISNSSAANASATIPILYTGRSARR